MDHVFPEETVKRIYEDIEIIFGKNNNHGPNFNFNIYRALISEFAKDHSYYFGDNLRCGQYVHYYHEKWDKNITGYNCTNIIPTIFLDAEALGFKPRIVQFYGFRDIQDKDDLEDPKEDSTHFSLIVDVGKSKPYLIDPFYNIFGPILEQNDSYLRVGKSGNFSAKKREFKRVDYFSAKEFAEMMSELLEPGKSLDMLVAGQKVMDSHRKLGAVCDLKIFYDDKNNDVLTRLFIDHTAISNKAIICSLNMDGQGETNDIRLDLYFAKDRTWADLIEEKKVASLDFKTARKIRSQLKKVVRFDRHERIGPALTNPQNQSLKKSLEVIVDGLKNDIDIEKIEANILARTLYEFTNPELQYLFSEEDHNNRLIELRNKELEFQDESGPIEEKLWLYGWKLAKFSRKEIRKLRKEEKNIILKKRKVVKETNSLNYFRNDNKHAYHRVMDQVLFAQKELAGATAEDLRLEVTAKGLDPRTGYLGIVADFLPFAFKFKDDLELKLYIGHIREKIKVRKGNLVQL